MALSDINARLKMLRTETDALTKGPGLQDKIDLAWRQHVLTELSNIFETHQDETACRHACQAFIENCWPIIKGTSVCYEL
jgi:hypothetical protein